MRTPMTESEVRGRLAEVPGWSAAGNARLTRDFAFTDHVEAFGFVTRVAMIAEKLDHHPDLRIVYNRVEITLSTHDANGLTKSDFELATRINALLGK